MTTLVRFPPTCTEVLDATYEALLGYDVHAGMGRLRAYLREIRGVLAPDEWTALGDSVRRHAVHRLLLESPFSRRAYEKPRGYAGDAVLMDLIYGITSPDQSLSPLGGMLHAYEFDSPCFQSVRRRRAILAREIDDVAATRPHSRIVSLACGHLRELEWSRAVATGAASITALDQDRDSLARVDADYRDRGVATRSATVGDVLRRSLRIAGADLAYAAGLYDYLADDVARALTAALFRMLAPGGRLLIANFTPATHDAAFMEAVMDWRLIYRTPDALRTVASGIPGDEIGRLEQFTDDNGHITYLRVIKR